ncbi:hypothetical protein ACFL0V_05750 [Nanoarchaeota archaeon]
MTLEDIADITDQKKEPPKRGLVRRCYDLTRKYIDYKMGAISAGVMGAYVWLVNVDQGVLPASTAAMKQGAYSFLSGGVLLKICEYLATRIKKAALSYMLAIAVPSMMAVTATYGLHSLKGTPHPVRSTIPAMVLAPPSCAWWARRKRREVYRENSY